MLLIKRDDIGPEISDSVVEIFDALKISISWMENLRLFDSGLGYAKA